MSDDAALGNYRALLAKVDAKFSEIASRHPRSFRCGAGCHSCCKPGLTVSPIEAEALRLFLSDRPELVERIRALEALDPHAGTRCKLLDENGLCTIYEARPLVCRSHGAPLLVETRRDVCPLNFTDEPLAAIPGTDLINLETLNTILALINAQFSAAASRVKLELVELSGSGGKGPVTDGA